MYPYIPYRSYAYQTPLSDADIRKAAETHAHLSTWDGMFIKSKPYHGEVSPGYLRLRPCSRYKKYGYSPEMAVFFTPQGSGQQASLALRPHGLLMALAVLFVGSSLFFLLGNIVSFFGTWDPAPIVVSLISTAILAGCFFLPYHFSAEKTVRFWQRELRLTAL